MNEPMVFGLPISMAFLYFITYAVMGWCVETVYCSVLEKRFVPRGFLYGPLCPIYGVGVLMMICWFQPLMGNPVLFYLTATVCMSAWEYLVGWFLETTTHIKYWDYSMYRFNLHGRICLWVCLAWGVLSFLVLYFIHPRVAGVLEGIPPIPRYFLDGVFLGILLADATATVYQLIRTSQMLVRLQQAGDELRAQVILSRDELAGKVEGAKALLTERLDDLLPGQLDEVGRGLKARYDELVSGTEMVPRRFRMGYRDMRSGRNPEALESVKRHGERSKLWRLGMKKKKSETAVK